MQGRQRKEDMMQNPNLSGRNDLDPQETSDWLDSLDSVIANEGYERAHFLLEALFDKARRTGGKAPFSPNTAYLNTIPAHLEAKSPGDHEIEHKLRSYVRWNAAMMVLRGGKKDLELGGHISSFASAATLYDVGFNHFWHAPSANHGGDLVYVQGHSAPGVYARAFMLDRLTQDQMDNFRQEVDGKGISSYPHPWLMPDFWQLPTVSMGLGPLMGIYQARFLKYLHARGLANTEGRKVWVFCGDGEMDEPESLGAISMAGREGLDNLVFVINCNLQRLDGPVRGNSRIVDELEALFAGAGWHVIKVLWSSDWDRLFARDAHGERAARRDRARVRRPLQRREVESPAVLPEVAALPDRAAVEEHGAARAEPRQEREVVVGVARDQPAIGVRATVHATVAHRVARQVQARERGGVEVERVDLVAAPVVVPAARDQQAIADRVERTAAVGGDAGAARSAVQCRVRRVARAQRTHARVRQLVPARAVRQHAALRDRGSGEAGDQDRRSLQGTGSGRITGATVAKPRRPIRELAGESVYARRVGLDAECSFPAFGSP